MTERSPSITTQIVPPIPGAQRTSLSLSGPEAFAIHESVDEEPYTIKCICDFSDDDGNTVYCEGCDTWQHIECYYPGRVEDASKEEFDHSCADCKPRSLDARTATERQRQHRQNKAISSTDEKKAKRPPSKSHKKKVKPSDVQVNGYHDDRHRNGSPHDTHHSTKKPKGHRASQSISSSKRSPPLNSRPQLHARPPSPAHTPPELPTNLQIHDYSDNFLTLYDDDDTYEKSSTNSFASLAVTNAMSSWVREPTKLLEETGKPNFDDVFQNITVPVNSLKWPNLRVDRKEDKIEGTHLKWRSLINTDDLRESGRIGEINGVVGFQKDYYNDSHNRWADCPQPRPFIFFCPQLPLFIDTRKEGSLCRYVRRSCRPNTTLELYIANGSEYHFWLVSDRPLAANEQVTIPWEFNFPKPVASRYLHLLNLSDGEVPSKDTGDITDAEYDILSAAIFVCLSDHGGCACDLGNDCAFARFHRSYHGRPQSQPNGVKAKKGRKPKQNHVSPTSTGHATNSRAASEGQDPYDDDDARSQSGSIRSKPHSRDMTPSHGVGENNGLFTEPSDREKRKLAMLEDSFRKMEQREPARKKTKRPSDTTATSATVNGTPQPKGRKPSVAPRTSTTLALNTNGSRPRQYVDASTLRRQSGSPFSAVSPVNGGAHRVSSTTQGANGSRQASVGPKPTYVSSGTQTDPVEGAWWEQNCKAKRRVVPLAKRLMKNRHKVQATIEAQTELARQAMEQQSLRASPAISMDLDPANGPEGNSVESPTDSKGRQTSISSTPSVDVSGDVNMVDAPAITAGTGSKPPPPAWPAQSMASTSTKPNDLRVQMPAPSSFSTSNVQGTPSTPLTPSVTTSSTAQSPFGTVTFPPNVFPPALLNGVAPSPVKTTKKLSLSDYKARMKSSAANKTTGGSNSTNSAGPTEVAKPLPDAKATNVLEGSTIVESPAPEKTIDPIATAGATVPVSK